MCELSKKTIKTCHCGATFVQYSTLQAVCPSCQIKALQQKKQSNTDKYSFIIVKHHSVAKTKQKHQKSEKQKAKATAWTWFSRFIKLQHSVGGKYCICYTCGGYHDLKNIDAGHFIPGRKDEILFNENGCRPQCQKCNRFKQGEFLKFEVHLMGEIGIEKVNELKEQARQTVHLTEADYRQISFIYKEKVKELQKSFGVKIW